MNMITIGKPNKLWLYLISFNSQVMKRIAYFVDLNLSWEYKISLNFKSKITASYSVKDF